jgi:GNAT superfamily N-acetyltransferase
MIRERGHFWKSGSRATSRWCSSHDCRGAAIGFSQLYPCFASVSLARMFVLYDLFVAPQARRCGAAAALLRAGVDYAAGQGAGQLMLQTGVTNLPAQRLYEREGWVRDNDFYVYEYQLPTDDHS